MKIKEEVKHFLQEAGIRCSCFTNLFDALYAVKDDVKRSKRQRGRAAWLLKKMYADAHRR